MFRFQHWLAEKTDYKASFRGKSSGAFECKPSTVAAAPAGPDGLELQIEVTFEPSSMGDNYHETLLVGSATGGEYECQVNGRCLPPKPSGPFEIVKVCDPQCCLSGSKQARCAISHMNKLTCPAMGMISCVCIASVHHPYKCGGSGKSSHKQFPAALGDV